MLPRQSARPFRVFASTLVLSFGWVLPGHVAAQTPNYPSVPAPQPVNSDTIPSLPAAVPAQRPENIGSPAEATQQNPAQTPSSPVAPAPGTPGQTNQAQPTSPNAAQPYVDPLQTPIHIQQAQPGQPQPVDIAPPTPVVSLPSIPTDYPMPTPHAPADHLGSVYIPVDDVIYPMALRLYSMGYLDTVFISMRPWTRRSLLHALEKSAASIKSDGNEQAMEIYAKLMDFLMTEDPGPANTLSSEMTRGEVYGVDTVYTRLMGITGLSLRDSYQLGQTIVDDYARPYQPGFNNITGFSTVNEWNRFSLYVRGEYQHAPSAAGFSTGLSSYLSSIDGIPFVPPNDPQDNIATGPIASVNPFRLQEAVLSFHLAGHEISGGKSDAWLGPGAGGAMAWSNNAENIYSFRINRLEPLNIPYVDKVLGALRYDFFVGSLKGHTFPNSPWAHAEMFSFRPSSNFEFSFERTVIWGGHCTGCIIAPTLPYIDEPVTLRSFFRSFFSFNDTQGDPVKGGPLDPGARFSDFSFSWRLPFLRHYVTLYTDSISHDDVSPISAPRRASYRPGVYLSQFPKIPKLDLRAEASSTDCSTLACQGGNAAYFEAVQRQGYTNKGFLMGDWVGREAKAGNAALTYHLSADEWIALDYLHKQTPQDFVVYGTTQNQYKLDVMKRLTPNLELNAWYQYERWAAPVYQTKPQHDSVIAFQFKFYPKLRTQPALRLNGKPNSAPSGGAQP